MKLLKVFSISLLVLGAVSTTAWISFQMGRAYQAQACKTIRLRDIRARELLASNIEKYAKEVRELCPASQIMQRLGQRADRP